MNPATNAVFLSYASQDAEAARALVAALRAAGIEVWFDQAELVGGDAWDAKIRSQIAACALFVPVISAATQARLEGFFRIEWKLAAQRSHGIAEEKAFLLPVVIDDTRDSDAKVPAEFRAVQWTRLPGGEPTAAFILRLKTILHPASAAPGPSAVSVPPASASSVSPKPKSRIPWLVAAGLAAGVLALAAFLLNLPRPLAVALAAPASPAVTAPAPTPAAPALDPKAIAVLPFANLSSEKDSEYFSDGLSEEILDKLAKVRGLRVMARTSSFYYKGKNTPLKQIAQELQVGNVIEGSVRRAGNKLRITAQLIDTTTGENVWSETFDRELTDIFAVQTEIAQKITARLTSAENAAATASLATANVVPTTNLAAYELYLRALGLQRQSQQGAMASIPLFQQAVALDARFTLAWLRMAEAATRTPRPQYLKLAREALAQARALDPDPQLAYIVEGRIALQANLFPAATAALAKAASLGAPTPELRLAEAELARFAGNPALFLSLAQEAFRLDPQNGDAATILGVAYIAGGNIAEAFRFYEKASALAGPAQEFILQQTNLVLAQLALQGPEATLKLINRDPNFGPLQRKAYAASIHLILGHEREARVLVREALPALQAALASGHSQRLLFDLYRLVDDPAPLRPLAEMARTQLQKEIAEGVVSARSLVFIELFLGDEEAALRELEAWDQRTASLTPSYRADFFCRDAAALYARLGRPDNAMALLQEAMRSGWHPGYLLQYLPAFAPIRNDPRFQALMKAEAAYAAAQPDPFAK